MTKTEALFTDILASYINKTVPSISGGELSELVLLSNKHKVFPIVYSMIKKHGCGFEAQDTASLRSSAMLETAAGIQKEDAFLKFYRDLEEIGISPIVVKGIILASLYPEKNTRFSSDEDVLFDADSLKRAEPVLSRHGLNKNDAAEDDTVWGYRNPRNGLYIEAHTKLFPEYPSHNLIMNEMFEDAFKNSITVNIGGTTVRTLCPTEHLLFLILHSFKHFIYCGFGIRQIMDFIVFARENKEKIDTEKILEALSKVNATGFFDGILSVCERYFSVSPRDLGFADYSPEKYDSEDLMKDILSGGAYGNSTKERLHSSKITLAATEEKGKASPMTSLFPPLSIMKSTYPYLSKRPYLLPVSWCQRIFAHFRKDKKERAFDAGATIEIGKERLRMMKKYKVIK